MTDRNDGGPAFPMPSCPTGEHHESGSMIYHDPESGMSLRDYAAIKIFAAMRASGYDNTREIMWQEAFKDADAILEARKA